MKSLAILTLLLGLSVTACSHNKHGDHHAKKACCSESCDKEKQSCDKKDKKCADGTSCDKKENTDTTKAKKK